MSMLSIGPLSIGIVVQGPHCQVVDVEPDGPTPVGWVVLRVVLREAASVRCEVVRGEG